MGESVCFSERPECSSSHGLTHSHPLRTHSLEGLPVRILHDERCTMYALRVLVHYLRVSGDKTVNVQTASSDLTLTPSRSLKLSLHSHAHSRSSLTHSLALRLAFTHSHSRSHSHSSRASHSPSRRCVAYPLSPPINSLTHSTRSLTLPHSRVRSVKLPHALSLRSRLSRKPSPSPYPYPSPSLFPSLPPIL